MKEEEQLATGDKKDKYTEVFVRVMNKQVYKTRGEEEGQATMNKKDKYNETFVMTVMNKQNFIKQQ